MYASVNPKPKTKLLLLLLLFSTIACLCFKAEYYTITVKCLRAPLDYFCNFSICYCEALNTFVVFAAKKDNDKFINTSFYSVHSELEPIIERQHSAPMLHLFGTNFQKKGKVLKA